MATTEIIDKEAYKELWQILNQINNVMWESYMIKDKEFGRNEGHKIMQQLEKWASKH